MKRTLIAAAIALAAIPALVIAAEPSATPKGPRGPDTNGDGYLSRTEAQKAADERFKRMDANGDGKLEKGERGGRRGPRQQAEAGGPPPHPGAEFGRREGRGPHGPGMRGGRGGFGMFGPGVFDEYDKNKDGALSLAEFRDHAYRMFEAQDGNRDGKIKLPDRPPQRAGHGKDKPRG